MTTITKEEVKAFIEQIESDLANGWEAQIFELKLARIALASLEAEPIGAFHIADQQVGGTSDYIKDGEWPIDNGVIEVYAAPPATVVPDYASFEEFWSSFEHPFAEDDELKSFAVEIWNACRAAMLQAGTLTNEGTIQAGNLPVIPDCSFSGLVNSARALLDALYEFGADEVAISEYVTNLEDALRVAAAPQREVK